MKFRFFYSLLLLPFVGCQMESKPVQVEQAGLLSTPPGNKFNKYWFAGMAELNGFELEQARYGEVHKGHAVMVFVTEPFLKDKQVKADNPQGNEAVQVMKLNVLRKFPTGIYDYSMMTSTFTPVDRGNFPHSLKVTCSSQEWCGHTFTQLNLKGEQYQVNGFSYFESEGDEASSIPATVLEDELLNMIRIDPKSLPTGDISILPGMVFTRLRHKRVVPQKANAQLTDYDGKDFKGKKPMLYAVDYPESNRSLKIYFEGVFPHEILGWEENWLSGFGNGAKRLTTKAVRTHQIRSDYWNQHSLENQSLRKKLGLPMNL